MRSGTLTSSKKESEQSVEEAFSDPTRDKALGGIHGLINIDPPTTSLSTECPSWSEVQEIVKHASIALDYYPIPHNIQGMITSYLRDIKLRLYTTKWQPVEKGIVTGCTISPILFIMGMNLIISAASTKSRGPKTAAGCQQPAIRAFMDDLTVITPTHEQARWVLEELDRMATWAKKVFKPKKSRRLVIQKGKTTGRFKLLVQGEVIPNIQGNPIKSLGKWYDDSLSDWNSISSTRKLDI